MRPATLTRLAVALGSAVVSLLVALPLHRELGPTVLLLFVPPVLISASYGGFSAGLTATLASVVLADYYLLPAYYRIDAYLESLVEIAVYVTAALVTSWLAARARGLRAELATTLASIGEGVIVVDGDHRILFVNPVAEQVTGWTAGEAWHRPLGEVFRLRDERTGSPSAPLAKDAASLGHARAPEDRAVLVRRDGSERPIEETRSPVTDERGRTIGAILVFRDASERRTIEQRRERVLKAEQEGRLQAEELLRQYRSLQERLSFIVEASAWVLRAPQLDTMLPDLLQLSKRLNAADAYALWLSDRATGEWRIAAADGLSEEYRGAAIPAFRAADPARLGFDRPILIGDVATAQLTAHSRETYQREGLQSLMAVPLRIGGEGRGALSFYYRSPRRFEEVDIRVATALSNLAAAAVGTAELYEGQSRLRAGAQAGEARSRFLAEASRILGSSLDFEETLRSVASIAVADLADWCAIDLLDGDAIRRLVITHRDPQSATQVEERSRRLPVRWPDGRGPARVIRTGEPEFCSDLQVTEQPDTVGAGQDHDGFAGLGLVSYLSVPIATHGRALGALTLANAESGRRFTHDDLAVAGELADRAALAIDNARLFREAQDATRTRDEFLATLSHEMRTPLNAVLGWARLLASGQLDKERERHAISTIERNAEAQAQLIDDLLDVSRFITGNLRLDVRALQLKPIVEAGLDSVRIAAEAKAIALEADLDPLAGPVAGDATRLQQIVWNLLSNAIKFTPRGGRVDVRLERLDGTARLRIRDTGQGIDHRFLPYVFDRFRQADSTSTRRHGGLGLGLAIVRHLVETHGGIVTVESPGEGLGTTFTVELPIMFGRAPALDRFEPEERVNDAPHSLVPRGGLEGIHVLVVEDDADARDFLVTVLEHAGARVTAVGSVRDALDRLDRIKVDVLLTDIGMPGEDGFALIRQVRAAGGERAQLPAAALTGFARPEDRRRAAAEGFQAHIAKPVEPDDLVLMIAELAGRSRVER